MFSECCICLESIRLSENRPFATPCGHIFHENCINKCLDKQRLCPQCNQRIHRATTATGVNTTESSGLFSFGSLGILGTSITGISTTAAVTTSMSKASFSFSAFANNTTHSIGSSATTVTNSTQLKKIFSFSSLDNLIAHYVGTTATSTLPPVTLSSSLFVSETAKSLGIVACSERSMNTNPSLAVPNPCYVGSTDDGSSTKT